MEPLHSEPGIRHRGASRAALKGRFANALKQTLLEAGIPEDRMAQSLADHSSPDGNHYLDDSWVKKILDGASFPDSDSFVYLMDALIELDAAWFLEVKALEWIYIEEAVAWDRYYRDTSGRVSETRRPSAKAANVAKRTKRTGLSEFLGEVVSRWPWTRRAVGERGFEPLIG